MRYATTAARSEVLHKQENGITRTYCTRTALHIVDPETASAGLSTGTLRVCKNCDRAAGDRRRAELSLADQPLLNPPATPARKKPATEPALFTLAPTTAPAATVTAQPSDEPTLFDEVPATEPTPAVEAPAKPRRTRRKAQPAAAAPVARNAFEQAAAGLLHPLPAGRYALQVCEETLDVCDRGACSLHSTRAAGRLDEIRLAAAMFRHAWAVADDGTIVPLTEQPVPAAAEQAPVEALPDGPMRVRVKMGIPQADLDRIKATAAADRIAFEADSAVRRAAERAKYGPQEPASAAVEGTVVEHQGETYGCLPKHADDEDVRAALAVLGGGGRLLPIRLAPMEGDSITGHPAAFGAVVEPRGEGRVALYWLGAGRWENEGSRPWRIEVEMLSERMARAGWLVEAGRGRRVVMAWRPAEQAPVEATAEIEQAPCCTECTGRGCHWCYWTGEQQPSE